MNIKTFAAACLTAATIFSCNKQEPSATVAEQPTPVQAAAAAIQPALACVPGYYNLAWDAFNNGAVYKISGSPGAGPVTVTPIIGAAGNNLIGGLSPVTRVTGLSYDPASGIAYAVTSPASNLPNRLIRFAIGNPSAIASIPLFSPCGIVLNVSDIERDPTTGIYYAINNSAVNPNNRIVRVNIATGQVDCLPNPLSTTLTLRGLSIGCNGQLYVLYAINNTGRVLEISKVTGLMTGAWSYPGVITPGGVGAPEMGLHFDCTCIGRFITGSFVGAPLLTDGLPSGLGGPLYNAAGGFIRPTVDFARP